MIDDQYSSQRGSSWDTKALSTDFSTLRMMPNVATISTPPVTNYVVPYGKYNSSVSPQTLTNERQIQKYQQSAKLQSYPSETSNPTQINSNKKNEPGFCAKHITTTRLIGLLIGLILTGVPLAVIVTLYVEPPSSNNSGSSSSNSVPSESSSNYSSVNLPNQCTNYNTLSDNYRVATYTSCGVSTCDSFNGWYRITGVAGTQLATSPVSYGGCGSYYPTWFNGSLPTTSGTTTSGAGCVNYNGILCHPSYTTYPVLATHCNTFYVFYLPALACICCSCNYPRYCTI